MRTQLHIPTFLPYEHKLKVPAHKIVNWESEAYMAVGARLLSLLLYFVYQEWDVVALEKKSSTYATAFGDLVPVVTLLREIMEKVQPYWRM